MHLTGKMDRTLTVDGVPSGRVRRAIKLDVQTDAPDGLFRRQPDDAQGRFPGRPAGCPPHHFNALDARVGYDGPKFGGSEVLSVCSQADLPGQAASGGGGKNPFKFDFFA